MVLTLPVFLQAGLDFYQAEMVGTLPTNLSSDVAYRGNAFTYEADTLLGFSDLTGGWCTGDEVGEHLSTAQVCLRTGRHLSICPYSFSLCMWMKLAVVARC